MKKRLFATLLLGLFVLGSVLLSRNLTAQAAQGGATRQEAVKMKMGDTLTGTVSQEATEQWYTFTTEKDKEYWYHFDSLTIEGTNANVTLYDEDFQAKGTVGGSMSTEYEMSFKLTPSSVYYICIQKSVILGATDKTEFKLKTSKVLDDAADTMGQAYTELTSGKSMISSWTTARMRIISILLPGRIPRRSRWEAISQRGSHGMCMTRIKTT